MSKKKLSLLNIVIDIAVVLLAVLIIYWLLELIFGGSPELDEFNFALILVIMGIVAKIYRETGELKVELRHFSKNVRESFNNMKNDMARIKRAAEGKRKQK